MSGDPAATAPEPMAHEDAEPTDRRVRARRKATRNGKEHKGVCP